MLPPDPKLKELIRKGVPPALRGWVWSETSGAAKLAAAASPHYYTSMALAGERSRWLKDIDQVCVLRACCLLMQWHSTRGPPGLTGVLLS